MSTDLVQPRRKRNRAILRAYNRLSAAVFSTGPVSRHRKPGIGVNFAARNRFLLRAQYSTAGPLLNVTARDASDSRIVSLKCSRDGRRSLGASAIHSDADLSDLGFNFT